MTEIKLTNTRSRRKEAFKPLDPANVRMYVCGPTVYDRAHIGNARPVVVFDVLYRLLRHVYGEKSVTYVRNFTDIDDKIMARAKATGRDIGAITEETIGWFMEDMGALGNLVPTHMPRATDYVGRMVAMTRALIGKGHAYEADGHVLFDVSSYKEYGTLSHRSLDEMIEGARVEVAPYKRDAMDFVLWKPSAGDQPGWDSPWGRGRPGWHIECSAMARDLLGETFDIHGGGIDLAFPHHENERAQSNCAHGTERMAQVWMHNGFLQVEGRKMAKSLGNFFTVKDLRDKGVPGRVIRFVLLSTHYRKPLDWTDKAADQADRTLARWDEIAAVVPTGDLPVELVAALSDDLNTPKAIKLLREFAKNRRSAELRAAMIFLGFGVVASSVGHAIGRGSAVGIGEAVGPEGFAREEEELIEKLLDERKAAREQRNFSRADQIRDGLVAAGVEVKDSLKKSGFRRTLKFDPAKLKALLDA